MFGVSVAQLAVFGVVLVAVGIGWLRRRGEEPHITRGEKVTRKRAELKSSRGYLRGQQLILCAAGLFLVGAGEIGWGVAVLALAGLLALITERAVRRDVDKLDAPPS